MIEISKEIQQALKQNKAVVALESTIISHGMPYPDNVKMARKVESIIRNEGAVPATIAVINGIIKVGLDENTLEHLAKSNQVLKLSKRDIAYAVSTKKDGATTVSGTMLIAAMAGIKVFATGGIGGVHRDAENTFDISRDLEELAVVDVAVVCAGAKAILDLPKTLEYLETKGVEVLGYKTDKLPAFYTSSSNYNVDYNMDSPEAIAKLMHTKWTLGIKGGMVIANPIPISDSMDPKIINQAIEDALASAKAQGIKGKESTPFLLSFVKDATKNTSLEANLALVYNNARLAAHIAKAYTTFK